MIVKIICRCNPDPGQLQVIWVARAFTSYCNVKASTLLHTPARGRGFRGFGCHHVTTGPAGQPMEVGDSHALVSWHASSRHTTVSTSESTHLQAPPQTYLP